jgi:hypothetical protein
MTPNSYQALLNKLDTFIRRYYKNQLIRGAIYFATATLLVFLLVIGLEYFGRYHSTTRAVLFYSFVAFSVFCLVRFVCIPLAKLYKLGTTLSYTQASIIIGNHFPEVKDKLLNVLQLRNEASGSDQSLLQAAINQKTQELQPIPFASAVNLNRNYRNLRYVAIPLLLYAAIYIIAPGMITDSSIRVLNYNQTYKPVAPFSFSIENKNLSAQQYTDFELQVKVSGSELPEEVFLVTGDHRYKLFKTDKLHFTYTFPNVQKDVNFRLAAGAFETDDYTLKTLAKPVVTNYRAKLVFPAYLGKKNEWVENPADLTLPAGTTVNWEFQTLNTSDVLLGFNGTWLHAQNNGNNRFSYSRKLFVSALYGIKTVSADSAAGDSLLYRLNVIPDAFPTLTADEKQDSSGKQLYFIGDAADDYGITRLAFRYRITRNQNTQPEPTQTQWIPTTGNGTGMRFYHQLNLTNLLQPGDGILYYFEVWDNDGVHGSKSTKSAMKELKAASLQELEAKTEAGSNALKTKMEQTAKEAKQLQKELKDLERKMMEKRELTWEEKKKLEKLLQQQKELVRKLDEIKKENEKLNREESEYKKQQQDILDKQEQLEKMFNELMDDEMKKLIREMEKMLEQQNKEGMKEEMEKMQLNNKDVEKELDRMLEQYKKLELEKKLDEVSNKLENLSEKQEELSKKSNELDQLKNKETKKQAAQELKQQQEQLSKEFKEAREELKEIEQQNKELEEPTELENTEPEQQEIEQQQEQSEGDLEKGDNKKAAEKQQKAAKKMKEVAKKMKDKKAEQEQKELELDAQALREILENTIQLSKDQEALMENMRAINGYNPQYVDAAQDQKKIKDNAKIIEDSLLALSKRVAELSSFVNREVSKLNDNLDRSVKAYGLRNFSEIHTRQQSSMMHANNLAVMLSDVLKQMQDQMQGEGEGKGKSKPKKPGKSGKGGGKSKSMSELKKAQEELNKQLREGLNKQEGKGDKQQGKGEQKPGGDKPGSQGQAGKPGANGMSSEQYARMAAQQQAIRQQMQKLMQEMGSKEKEGAGGQKQLQEMQKLMEQTEKELFNKQLSNQMLQRQQDIVTRMLESEKAERKQEEEQRREAEQAKQKPATVPPDFEQYLQQKKREQELLETIPAEMLPYYKQKTREYFNKVGK